MVQGDGQVVLVQLPQGLEGDLRLEAGIDEDQRRARPADGLIDLGHGVAGGEAGPRHPVLGQQHIHHRGRAGGAAHDPGRVAPPAGGAEPGGQGLRIRDGGRQPHPPQVRAQHLQPGEAEAEQVAALGAVQHVDLVQDHRVEAREIVRRPLPGAEQGQLLRRGDQYVRRRDPLAALLGLARVAGAGLGGDRQTQLQDRGQKVAVHVHRQRLQRRDVEGVQPPFIIARAAAREVDQAGQEAGQGLAAAGGGDQQGIAPVLRGGDHVQLVRPGRPAAPGEPVLEAGREQGGGVGHRRGQHTCSRSVRNPRRRPGFAAGDSRPGFAVRPEVKARRERQISGSSHSLFTASDYLSLHTGKDFP